MLRGSADLGSMIRPLFYKMFNAKLVSEQQKSEVELL